jgi:hypothetical protein
VPRRVDLATEHALRARHRDARDLAPELLPRPIDLDLDLGAGALEVTVPFRLSLGLGLPDDVGGASIRLVDDAAGLLAGRRNDLVGLAPGLREAASAALGGREAIGDLDLTRLDRVHDVRPDVLHREPHEEEHRDGLADQGQID